MVKPKKPLFEKITVRGEDYPAYLFKPHVFDECTLPDVGVFLEDTGEIARNGAKDIDSLVRNSPLLRIEGQLRFQLSRLDDEHGLILDHLQEPSDFIHGREFIHNLSYVCNSKVVFLFDFLSDIVYLSHYPDEIDQQAIDKIKANLRALSFLTESQLTGSTARPDPAWDKFARGVWNGMGARKVTGQQFWDRCVKVLDSHDGEVTLTLAHYLLGNERKDTFVIRLEQNKSDKDVIKTFCEAKGVPGGRTRSCGQVKNIWKDLQATFIKSKK